MGLSARMSVRMSARMTHTQVHTHTHTLTDSLTHSLAQVDVVVAVLKNPIVTVDHETLEMALSAMSNMTLSVKTHAGNVVVSKLIELGAHKVTEGRGGDLGPT